jgi:uncharacterized membrane protein
MVLISWMLFNAISFFSDYQFDKYPFILLNLVLSFIASFQAPFIMMSQNRSEAKQDEAYRGLFAEIKDLVGVSIDIEKNMIEMIATDREDEAKYRKELSQLTLAIKEMVELDHSDEVQYKREISQLVTIVNEIKAKIELNLSPNKILPQNP